MNNKTQNSILNALSALIYMVTTSVFGLVLNHDIITIFGSDYNGVNATITQIVNAIMILEGGFLLASTVALFKPLSANDIPVINGILSATKSKFVRVGLLAVVIGFIVSLIYPFFLSTNMPYHVVVILMLFVLFPACFNLGISQKYRAILLAEQKEYVVNIISTITYVAGVVGALLLIRIKPDIILVRFVIMIALFVNYCAINIYCKKKYKYVDFSVKPMFEKINGTNDVIALKVTSVVYTAIPIMAISMIPSGGTFQASVYAVYKSITNLIKGALSAATNAPRLSFGVLLAEGDEKKNKQIFQCYELLSCMLLSVFLGTTCLLILPFISLYTRDVTDVMYIDRLLALIILTTVFVETIHIPSGQIIQMSGRFSVSKKIQLTVCVVLLAFMIIGISLFEIYGVALAILLAAVVLAILEIGYVAKTIFRRSIIEVFKYIVPSAIICTCSMLVGFNEMFQLNSYLSFICAGLMSFFAMSLVTLIVYYCVDRDNTKQLINKMWNFVKGFKKK